MIAALIYILVLVIVVALIFWVIRTLGVPEPLGRIITVAVVVIAVLIVVLLLLQAFGLGGGMSIPKV